MNLITSLMRGPIPSPPRKLADCPFYLNSIEDDLWRGGIEENRCKDLADSIRKADIHGVTYYSLLDSITRTDPADLVKFSSIIF